MLDATHEGRGHFHSLDRSFTPQVPVGADLGEALEHLLDQALAHQFPDHPQFEHEVKKPTARRCWPRSQKAARAEDGRVRSRRPLRPVIKLVANPLGLGHMGEQYFVLEKSWKNHFNKQLAAEKKTTPTVGEAARSGWTARSARACPPRSATC